MRFLDVYGAVRDLKEGRVSDRKAAHYFLATLALDMLGRLSGDGGSPGPSWARFGSVAAGIAILVMGVLACLAANRDGDDRDFLKRFIVISFPIDIVLMVIMCLVSIPFGGLLFVWMGKTPANDSAFAVQVGVIFGVISVVISIIGYVWKRKCIAEVSNHFKSQASDPSLP